MARPKGESKRGGLLVDFNRHPKLEFRSSKITSDGEILTYREFNDALGLYRIAGDVFQDYRTG